MKKSDILRPARQRSPLRTQLGLWYYGMRRRALWVTMDRYFATGRAAPLPFETFRHQTPLLRQLSNTDMELQYNKITNLKLATAQIDGVVIRPGEVFSYWKLIGKPSRRKGYTEGMVLSYGHVERGVGGGLCQLSNLLFWMALHSPLTVVERHRHDYDVFPDANRSQPFGSGATCFYPHGDLMLRNDTNEDFQFCAHVGDEFLEGSLRSTAPSPYRYAVVERNHEMRSEFWGGYTRHNTLYRQTFDENGTLLREEYLFSNDAIMMYDPFIEAFQKDENKFM